MIVFNIYTHYKRQRFNVSTIIVTIYVAIGKLTNKQDLMLVLAHTGK
jgi:hypothetical protein